MTAQEEKYRVLEQDKEEDYDVNIIRYFSCNYRFRFKI